MLKFGTGQITITDDQEDRPLVRTASAFTEDQRADVLAEGEEATEGE
jgi:hypothetical protein